MSKLYETLEKIDKLKQHKRKVDQLKEAGDFTLKTIIQGTYTKSIDFKMPPGSPPLEVDDEKDDIEIVPRELNEMIKFCMNFKYKQWQRETKFMNFLKRISPNDAKVLVAMKDKDLSTLFPTFTEEFIKEVFPQYVK